MPVLTKLNARHKWYDAVFQREHRVLGITYHVDNVAGHRCQQCGMMKITVADTSGYIGACYRYPQDIRWTQSRKYPPCRRV